MWNHQDRTLAGTGGGGDPGFRGQYERCWEETPVPEGGAGGAVQAGDPRGALWEEAEQTTWGAGDLQGGGGVTRVGVQGVEV